MTNALQVFEYNGAQVRTVEKDGEAWFVAKDVCDILGIQNHKDAIKALDDDEKSGVDISDPHGRVQMTNAINEPGMYKLIFRSHKPEAKAFTRWVTHEVLPQIHRYGMYMTDKVADTYRSNPDAFSLLMTNYLLEKEENQKLRDQIESERAYTTLGKIVLAMPGSMTVKEAADLFAQKGFPMGQNRLYDWCRKEKLTCSRKGTQYNKPTHRAIQDGLMNTQIVSSSRTTTMITPRGLSYLADLFMHEFYPLVAKIDEEEETD